jgi:Na+-driven multidrug efflux pump
MHVHQHSFINVFWPLLIEIFLVVLVSLSDTLMLYAVSHEAVAAVGSAIKTGFYVGAQNFKKAQRRIFKISAIGMGISMVLGLLIAQFPTNIISIFTSVENIEGEELIHHIELIRIVLWFLIGVEGGRAVNIILGESLKSTGDAWFLGTVSLFSLMFFAIGGSFYFTFVIGNGVIGIFIALMVDEIFKSLIFLWRWTTRRWSTRVLAIPIQVRKS